MLALQGVGDGVGRGWGREEGKEKGGARGQISPIWSTVYYFRHSVESE